MNDSMALLTQSSGMELYLECGLWGSAFAILFLVLLRSTPGERATWLFAALLIDHYFIIRLVA